MSIVRKFQNNFTTGIISEGVSARSDLEKYASACKDIENGIVKAQGGITKRPGLQYIAGLESYGLLIPFQYSESQSCVLVFIHKKVFVYNHGELEQEVTSPYSLAELDNLRFTQSADVLFLAHKDYAVRKLYRTVYTDAEGGTFPVWYLEKMSFTTSNRFQVRGFTKKELGGQNYTKSGTKTIPITGYGAYDSSQLDESKIWLKYAVSVVLNDGSESTPAEAFCIPVSAVWPSGAKICLRWLPPSGNITVDGFASPRSSWNTLWRNASATEYRADPEDGVHLFMRRYPEFVRTAMASQSAIGCFDTDSDTYCFVETSGGVTSWSNGETTVYTATASPVKGTTVYEEQAMTTELGKVKKTYAGYKYSIRWFWVITKTNYLPQYDTFEEYGKYIESCPMCVRNAGLDKKKYTFTEIVHDTPNSAARTITYYKYSYYFYKLADIDTYANFIALGKNGQDLLQSIAVDAKFYDNDDAEVCHVASLVGATDVARYFIYKDVLGGFGYVGCVEEPGLTEDNSDTYRQFMDDYISPDYATGLKKENDPFGSEDGADTNPSAVGIFQQRLVLAGTKEQSQTVWMSESGAFNSFGTHSPLIASDSIEVTIDSRRVNAIRHFVYVKNGLVLTEGAEYTISSGDSTGAISPTSIKIAPQSYWGSSDVPPITIGTYVLFLQNSGRTVRDFCYKYTEDSYIGEDMTVLADDILDSPVADWAYQQSPNSTVWVVCEDGNLKSFTYMREQEVYAWAKHSSGDGKFLSACCIREDGNDIIYFMVKRGDEYSLERMATYSPTDDAESYRFLDSYTEITSAVPTTSFTDERLARFNGKEVSIYAVGPDSVSVIKTTISGSSVTLSTPANVIVVGYPYTMSIETVDPEIKSEGGSVIGDKRSVTEASLLLRKTAPGLKVGSVGGRMEEVKMRRDEASLPLTTGCISLTVQGNYKNTAEFVMVHDAPTPCTILGLMTKISVG